MIVTPAIVRKSIENMYIDTNIEIRRLNRIGILKNYSHKGVSKINKNALHV